MKRVLVVNSGSSSLKYALFNQTKAVASGYIERIGDTSQTVKHVYNDGAQKQTVNLTSELIPSHIRGFEIALSLLEKYSGFTKSSLYGVGHRVVHGGPHLTKACMIDQSVISAIREAVPLAPLHNPANLLGIETALDIFDTKQVAVFDTAFHANMPARAYHYSIPRKFYDEYSVRRYGFHGISHEFIAQEAAKHLGKPLEQCNFISCHLGAGNSLACIKNGVSIDTTMGMTPLEGLTMATRCGDLDAGVVFFLMNHVGMTAAEVESMLQKESGWYGLSGMKDAREVESTCAENNERSLLTVEVIAHRIRKYLGAYHWNLGGDVDAILFTGGVGENWARVRSHCLRDTKAFGFEVDESVNENCPKGGIVDISTAESKTRLLVIPTNEELNIARQTIDLIRKE